jgi:hypothetical protein
MLYPQVTEIIRAGRSLSLPVRTLPTAERPAAPARLAQ